MSGDGRTVGTAPVVGSAVPVVTAAIGMSVVLMWRASHVLADRRTAVNQLRLDTWLDPSAARLAVTVLGGVGIVAAVLLLGRRTRALGARTAAGGLLVLAVYLVAVWVTGRPVGCLCTISARRGDWFSRGEAIVVALAFAVVCECIARGSDTSGRPHDREAVGL